MRLDTFDAGGANALLAEMAREATALVAPGARGQKTVERRLAYMRYVGQGHEITVALPVRALSGDRRGRRCARPSRRSTRRCSRGRSRGRRSRC